MKAVNCFVDFLFYSKRALATLNCKFKRGKVNAITQKFQFDSLSNRRKKLISNTVPCVSMLRISICAL